ncbi:transporter substrate-binding domain-containing protein [Castellaniella sp.]|uniref:transporter substrate-binding domain-containing protein n=1 Tax=Castellaniella sp. TaxID=1955812 RepID=UPI003C750810
MKRNILFAAVLGAALCASSLTAAAKDLLTQIKEKKEIVIATEAAYKPYEYIENGKIVGYDKDLLDFVMEGLPGVKLTQIDVPWASVLPGLAVKKFDFVVTVVGITRERYDNFALTYPIGDGTVALLKRASDNTLVKPEDINGQVVGSQVGSSQLRALQKYNEKQISEGKPGVKEIKEYAAFDEAYADLAAGRTAAVAQSMSSLAGVVKERPDTFVIMTPTVGPKAYFSWVGRKDADSKPLVDFFNERIALANTSGKMKELQMKWFGFEMPVPTHVPEPLEID